MPDSNPNIDAVLATRCDPLDNQPETILKHFRIDNLSKPLAAVVKPFAQMAAMIVLMCPRNPERTVALRKLLESMDAALRSTT